MSSLLDFIAPNGAINTPVVEAVAVGDLAVFFDQIGVGKWKKPPALIGATQSLPPYYAVETSGAIRGSLTVITAAVANPATCALAGGGFAEAYNETGVGVKLGLYDASGNAAVSPFIVDAAGTGKPAVSGTLDGGAVIAWVNSTPEVAWQRFNSSGVSVASGTLTGVNQLPAVACLLNGDYVIAGGGASNTIKFSRFNSSNAAQQTLVTAATLGAGVLSCNVAALTGGGFAFCTHANSSQAVTAYQFNAAGVQVGGTISPGTATSGGTTSLCGISDGGFVVTWARASLAPQFARYSAAGALQGAVTTVGTVAAGNMWSTGTPDGGFAISQGVTSGVVTRYKSDGTITGAPIAFVAQGIAALADGGFILTGQNGSNFAQFARYAGTAVTVNGAVSVAAAALGTATIKSLNTQTLTVSYTPGNILHGGGRNPGINGAIFGLQLVSRGLA